MIGDAMAIVACGDKSRRQTRNCAGNAPAVRVGRSQDSSAVAPGVRIIKNALSLKQAVLTQADRADRLVTAGGSDTSFNGKGLLA